MWWPGPTAATWAEAHNSAGLTATGRKWALAEGEVGGSRGVETYILIANRGAADTATVTLLYEDGTMNKVVCAASGQPDQRGGRSDFPNAVGKRGLERLSKPRIRPRRSLSNGPCYSNAGGVVWAAGTNAVATKLK